MEQDNSISQKQLNRIKQTSMWFNGTTKLVEQMDNIKKFCIEFPYYAYIIHQPDSDDDRLHIHFLVCNNGKCAIKSVAERLSVDYGVVQATRTPRTYSRYMLHKGFDKSDKYTIDDVVTNNKDRFAYFIDDSCVNSRALYADFKELASGRILPDDFIEKYQGEMEKLNFYQKMRLYREIYNIRG